MTLSSMTGFAAREGSSGPVRWAWELRSVNGRGLDLKLRLPPGLDGIEPEARALLQRALARGNVSANLTVKREVPALEPRLNEGYLGTLLAAASALAARHGAPPPRVEALLLAPGVIERVEPEAVAPDEGLRPAILEGLGQAVDALVEARRQEGGQLAAILARQLEEMRRLVAEARRSQAGRTDRVKEKLAAAVGALLEAAPALDPERLHQEAVMIALRSDVEEELDRLEAHLRSAAALVGSEEPAGRRLDFLSQEFNREANTICSKSAEPELTAIGLQLKVVIDQFREQVQNVQ